MDVSGNLYTERASLPVPSSRARGLPTTLHRDPPLEHEVSPPRYTGTLLSSCLKAARYVAHQTNLRVRILLKACTCLMAVYPGQAALQSDGVWSAWRLQNHG